MTLYELTEEFQRLYEVAEEDDPDALQDTLDILNDDLEHKIDDYVAVCRMLDSDIDVLYKEEQRIRERRMAKINNLKAIKKRMQMAMDTLGKRKIQTALNTVTVQPNGGRLPIVLDVLPEELPLSLVKVRKEPDMEAIRGYLEDGGDGVAHFGERGRSLRIK
jgi:hypothetical protein